MDAVLFDWDGTLLDSLPSLYRANVAVMAAFGLPFDEGHYRRGFAADWRLMYQNLGVTEDRLDEANRVWNDAFDGGHDALLLPGARDALDRLQAAGRPLGLVTAGHREIVAPQLERHRLSGTFSVVVYGDDLPVHKPDPRPLRHALARLGLAGRPDRSAYLGDTRDDVRMARAAGVYAVGIASLLGDPDDLRAAGAHAVASSVAAWVDEELAGVPGDPPETAPLPVGEGLIPRPGPDR
jgi:phosphoglycolate phosphatase